MSSQQLVVIGASAGGVEALQRVVGGLGDDFAAAVLVVLHIPPHGPSVLPQILGRAGPLPANAARDGDEILGGHLYTAPPDHHLSVVDGRLSVARGPKEHGHRPAVDVLFRSAAAAYGPRLAALILSGTRGDGAAGLAEVHRHGGVTMVQDPEDALYPSMPEAALALLDPHAVVSASEAGPTLKRLLADQLTTEPLEKAHVTDGPGAINPHPVADPAAHPSPFPCPDCGGVLWESRKDPGLLELRCRVGHRWSADSLFSTQVDGVERAMYAAMRILEDRAHLTRRLAELADARGHRVSAEHFRTRADEAIAGAAAVHALMNDPRIVPRPPGTPGDESLAQETG